MTSSSEPSRKQGREEDDDDKSRHRRLIKMGTVPTPEEALPPPPEEPEEVPPPVPEEAPTPSPVEAVTLPQLHLVDIWYVNMFLQAFRRLRRVAVELGLPQPNDLLQRTMRDCTYKIHDLARDLEGVVIGPHDDNDDDGDVGSFNGSDNGGLDGSSSGSDSDGEAPLAATTSA
jgi:hypothetical protein